MKREERRVLDVARVVAYWLEEHGEIAKRMPPALRGLFGMLVNAVRSLPPEE